jgi:hypothetical protein
MDQKRQDKLKAYKTIKEVAALKKGRQTEGT